MHELVPIVVGALLGAVTLAIPRRWVRIAVIACVAIPLGVVWSRTVGEEGALFAAWDAAQTFGAALLAAAFVQAVRRSRPSGAAAPDERA